MMKLMLMLFNLFTAVTIASAQEPLSVQDAIELGLKYNFDIRIARNDAEVSRNNRGFGTAGFLPILNVFGGASQSHSNQDTNSPFSFGTTDTRNYNGTVSLDWTLFDGFAMFADNARYRELARLGELQARDIIENTVVGILRSFFNLVQQEQLMDVAKNSVEISQDRLDREGIRRDLGGASSTDFLDAQVAYNQDKALVLNQEVLVVTASQQLNVLLGRDPTQTISVDKNILIPQVEMEYSALLENAREHNASLLAAQQSKLVADREVTLARSGFFPVLSLGADYGYTDRRVRSSREDFEEDITTTSRDASVGLQLSWNLFNGKRDRIAVQNARIDQRSAELALRDAENQLAGAVQQALVTFRNRMELVELEDQNVVAAQSNLERWTERYQLGTATSIEFRDAQVNLLRAQSAQIVARYQARITRLELEKLVGNLRIE